MTVTLLKSFVLFGILTNTQIVSGLDPRGIEIKHENGDIDNLNDYWDIFGDRFHINEHNDRKNES